MGIAGMRALDIGRTKDHGVFALVEIGVGHPQTCMADGVMASTGCTYGKLLMERLGFGKMATILHAPGRGTVRVSLRPEFQDALGTEEFFAYRKRGVEPSEIPEEVTNRAVTKVLESPESSLLKVERVTTFEYSRPKGSFTKVKCDGCGEYVFERYARARDGKTLCIPCSGFVETRVNPLAGGQ